MSIDTNITLTAPQKEYYQRFVNLGVNDLPMPQGDGVIRISPFEHPKTRRFSFVLSRDIVAYAVG